MLYVNELYRLVDLTNLDHIEFSLQLLNGGVVMAVATLGNRAESIARLVVDTHQKHRHHTTCV